MPTYAPDATKIQAGLYYAIVNATEMGLVKIPIEVKLDEQVSFDAPVEGKTPFMAISEGHDVQIPFMCTEMTAALFTTLDPNVYSESGSKIYFGGTPRKKSSYTLSLLPITAGDMQIKEIYFHKVVCKTNTDFKFSSDAKDTHGFGGVFYALRDTAQTNGQQVGYISFTASDVTAPTISSISPTNGQTGVATSSNIVLTFSELMATGASGLRSVENIRNVFLIEDPTGTEADEPCALSFNTSNFQLTMNPTATLTALTWYLVVVTTNVADVTGNRIAAQYLSSFQTA